MNRVGLMRIGAMLAVLLILVGAFAALPYWNAKAQTNTIWGIVKDCSATPFPRGLGGVTVSLIDAQGSKDVATTTTLADGSYSFTPTTGSYIVRFEIPDYFTYESPVTRFDDSVPVPINACLTKMPVRDVTLQVVVVDQVSTVHQQEAVAFPRTFFANDNIVGDFDSGINFATTSHRPVFVNPAPYVTWSRGAGTTQLINGTDYIWFTPFNGTLQLLNSPNANVIRSDLLSNGTLNRWLNVTYWYARPWAQLLYYPVVPGSYTVYKGTVSPSPWPAENVDWSLNIVTGVLTILANFRFGIDNVWVSYSSTGVVPGATVNLYNATYKQVVGTGSTNSSGGLAISIWGALFELQVQKEGYRPYANGIDTRSVNATRVELLNGTIVVGHAFQPGNKGVIRQGLVGYLYNTNPVLSDFRKVIGARVEGSQYIFYAEPSQTYRMIIDADGYKASVALITTPASGYMIVNSTLTPSLKEEYRSEIIYRETDWNNLTIYRNLTLRPDSTIPGIDLDGIRSLEVQVDNYFGNKNGFAVASDYANLSAWLRGRLAFYISSTGFLTTNSQIYNQTPAASYTLSLNQNPPGGNAIWVNSSASYTLRGTQFLKNSQSRYWVNLTLPDDTNLTVYRNQTYVVDLPRGYEMTSSKTTGPITTTGWTRIAVEPGLAPPATASIDMVIDRSENGSANARVEGPAGKFYVVNSTKENYTVVVAAKTNITFSADQSVDPIGNIQDANFTWRFQNNTVNRTNPVWTKYGMTPVVNYTAAGKFQANLTVVEAGGNRTYRDVIVYADDTAPVAVIKHNKTSASNTNGTTLRLPEDTPLRFDGSASTDEIFPGADINAKDKIPDDGGYAWDFNGDNITDRTQKLTPYVFDKPGQYNMTLRVTDWVGHVSVNATMVAIANDTTKPTPDAVVLDPGNDWAQVTTLIEGKEYAFNASTSSDNYDSNKNLTYKWHFPGNATAIGKTLDPKGNVTDVGEAGWNITVRWDVFNLSYKVDLNVTDTGFGWNNPAKRNAANRTLDRQVGVDTTKHPDLKYVANTLKITPGDAEENQAVNVSLAIENILSRANATDVKIRLYERDANGNLVLLSQTPEWRDAKWNPVTNHTIANGTKVNVIFTVSFSSQGNKSLQVVFNDTKEPYTWVDAQNRVSGSVFVRLAGWVLPVAGVSIVAIIIAAALGWRYWSRYKSGELVFRRKEKKEKKKKVEEKEEDEEPEAEDKKGKKRL